MNICFASWCFLIRFRLSTVEAKRDIDVLVFSSPRFNKLGLDKIANGEEPNPSNQVEEVHSYAPVQSAPLNSERIVHVDIGTAHSVAVTGSGEYN